MVMGTFVFIIPCGQWTQGRGTWAGWMQLFELRSNGVSCENNNTSIRMKHVRCVNATESVVEHDELAFAIL